MKAVMHEHRAVGAEAPGRAGVPPADLGVPPRSSNFRAPLIRSRRHRWFDLPGGTPGRAGGTPTLPGAGWRCALIGLAALILSFTPTHAKETKAEAAVSEEPDIVIVPYDPKNAPADQNPDQLYLPYERFLKLWQAAKEHKRPPAEVKTAPLPYGLTSARYEAKLEQRGILITGQLDLFTGHAWVKVPLSFSGAKVSSLTIDGQAAVWENDELLVEKQGRHQVQVAFELSRALGAVDFKWGIPRASATTLALTIPQPETTATIEPGSGAVEQLSGGARIVTAALGSANEVRIHLRTAEKPATAGAPVAATIAETARLSASWEEFQADAEFSFPSSVQDKFTILLEKGLTLTDLSAPNLKSWTLRPEGPGQALDLELYEPAKETFTVHVATQRFPAPKATAGTIPLFSTSARRTELGSLAVFAVEGATATLTPAGGLRQIPWTRPPPEGWRLAGAYAGAGTLQYQLAVKTPRREAKVEYLYQVGRRQLELFASMELLANGDPLESLQLELPPGFDVETLQSTRPHTWWRTTAGNLVVAFENATPESTKLVLHLVQKAPPAAALEIRSVKFVDFHKVTSEVVIAARKGVDTALTLPALATDLKPEEAVPSFDVVPPLERKRAFRSATGDFTGQVQLTSRTPRAEAVWALRVEAHEAWLGLSYAVQLKVSQGSLDSARFTLPAPLAEARVAGGEVREARSKVEGAVRTYDVSFQNEVTDSVEFTVDLEIPHTGEAALPAILFPGTTRASGFLAIDNASEGEMRLATTGLDKATVAELPWKVPEAQRSELYRVPPADWSAKVIVERLEKATGRLAFCPWAEFSTAFRRDGTEWHKAVWHLQNRALQFLPVRLPIGAELVSVRVAGQSVRADEGKVQDGPALLIPLIKTKPGELSYDVEAVFRIAKPTLEGTTKRTLDDPDLLGITVERTFWNIWAPAGFEILPARGGNMEQIIGDVAVADKLDDTLQELKRLNGIMNLSGAGSETRQIAGENFKRLQRTIESNNRELAQQQQDREPGGPQAPTPAQQREADKRAGGKESAKAQTLYVQKKMAEVNKELEKQVQEQVRNDQVAASSSGAENKTALGFTFGSVSQGQQPQSFNDQNGRGAIQQQLATSQGVRNNWQLNPTMNKNTVQNTNGDLNLALNDNVQYKGNASKQPGAQQREQLYNSVDELNFSAPNAGQAGQQSLSAARAFNNGLNITNNAQPMPQPDVSAITSTTRAGQGTVTLNGTATYSGSTTVTEGTLRPQSEQPTRSTLVPTPTIPPLPSIVSADPAQPSIQMQIPGSLPGSGRVFGSGGTTGIPPAQLVPPPAAAPKPAAGPADIATLKGPRGGVSFDTGDGLGRAADGGFTSFGDDRDGKKAAPRPTPIDRRITLAVDFPTEGEPIHFKKLKGAATVRVELTPQETVARGRNAVFLALAAALLYWARRRFGPRSRYPAV